MASHPVTPPARLAPHPSQGRPRAPLPTASSRRSAPERSPDPASPRSLSQRFQRVSIRAKLTLMILAACAIALLVAGISLMRHERRILHDGLIRTFSVAADILAENLGPSLAFDDRDSALHILGTLESLPSVEIAAVVDNGGREFAQFVNLRAAHLDAEIPRPLPATSGFELDDRHVVIHRLIQSKGENVGYLFIRADLAELHANLRSSARILLMSLAGALTLTALIFLRLQTVVSHPLRLLTDLARRVARDKDYSLRAQPRSLDEIGQLTASFNEMLAEIGRRDLALQEARDLLESRVDERTRELRIEIVERQKAEEASRRAARTAEAASRAKSEFLATVSHEIRTPMNGILGCTRLLLETQLDATQRRFVDTAQSSAKALLHVINDILDFSKIEAGRMTLDSVPFEIRPAIHDVVRLLFPQAQAKSIPVEIHIADDIPARLRGDPIRVRQVLLNLLGNAIKFTDHGSIRLEATMVDAPDQPRFHCAVHDTGIGIAPGMLARLFNQFTQLDASSTRRHGGTGLGLAISKRLLELMGGSIGVHSEPGRGSTFWFSLPIDPTLDSLPLPGQLPAPPHTAPAPASTPIPPRDATPVSPGCRVLVVDDNEVNQMLASCMLESLGCHVEIAVNGLEAVDATQARAFDLVFMDCLMPELDGYEATRTIRRLESEKRASLHPATPAPYRRLPIVALTANAMAGDWEKCLAAGMDDYLSKPFEPEDLQRILQRWAPAGSWEI